MNAMDSTRKKIFPSSFPNHSATSTTASPAPSPSVFGLFPCLASHFGQTSPMRDASSTPEQPQQMWSSQTEQVRPQSAQMSTSHLSQIMAQPTHR
jgi:hypothetical protein